MLNGVKHLAYGRDCARNASGSSHPRPRSFASLRMTDIIQRTLHSSCQLHNKSVASDDKQRGATQDTPDPPD